jgi:hypothetical protein
MTHRATQEQWRLVEQYADSDCSPESCIIELRERIASLEAGATCPHIISSDEGTSYCGLAEQIANSNYLESPDSSPAPAGGLVEMMATTLAACDTGDDPSDWRPEARAAILSTADYLEDRNDHTGARWLREEVERG